MNFYYTNRLCFPIMNALENPIVINGHQIPQNCPLPMGYLDSIQHTLPRPDPTHHPNDNSISSYALAQRDHKFSTDYSGPFHIHSNIATSSGDISTSTYTADPCTLPAHYQRQHSYPAIFPQIAEKTDRQRKSVENDLYQQAA